MRRATPLEETPPPRRAPRGRAGVTRPEMAAAAPPPRRRKRRDGSAGPGKMAAPSLLRGGLRRIFSGLLGNSWAAPPARALRQGESGGGSARPRASLPSRRDGCGHCNSSCPPASPKMQLLLGCMGLILASHLFFLLQSWR